METKPERVSAKAIMDRLDVLAQTTLQLNPRQLVIYKPNPKDESKGGALKIGYRFAPLAKEDGTPSLQFTGGVFLELVSQIASDGEHPRFDWKGAEKPTIVVKLGLPDLSAMLLSYKYVRELGRVIPERMRPVSKEGTKFVPDPSGMALALIHKTDTATKTIKWTFDPTRGSFVDISQGREFRKSVSLTLTEELQFVRYLQLAMDALLLTGA